MSFVNTAGVFHKPKHMSALIALLVIQKDMSAKPALLVMQIVASAIAVGKIRRSSHQSRYGLTPFLDEPGRIAGPNFIRRNTLGHYRTGSDYGVFANFHIVAYDGSGAHESMVAYLNPALPPHDTIGERCVQRVSEEYTSHGNMHMVTYLDVLRIQAIEYDLLSYKQWAAAFHPPQFYESNTKRVRQIVGHRHTQRQCPQIAFESHNNTN